MRKLALCIIALILFSPAEEKAYAGPNGNRKIQSFSKAKRIMMRDIYRGHQVTFYCGSQYTQGMYVIHNNGYIPVRKSTKARRLEWEHVVHLDFFGHKFSEWSDGHPACLDSRGRPFKGQNCAEKMNREFRFMQCDLYNLIPAIGELTYLRSSYRYGMISGEKRRFGLCDVEIAAPIIEPPQEVRGDIARIFFYMDWAYPGFDILTEKDKKLFMAWDKQDAVDAWECQRAKRVEEIQMNENPFVKKACMKKDLWQ